MYSTTILPFVLYGCETGSLTLREGSRPRMLENRLLGKILVFLFKRGKVTGEGKKLHIDKIHYFCTSPNIARTMKSRKMSCEGHVAPYGGKERCTQGVLCRNLRERDHLEELGLNGTMIFRWILKKPFGKAWAELMWFKLGTNDGLLWTRLWTFGFHNTQGISVLTKEL